MSKRLITLVIMALFLTGSLAIAQVVPTAKITGKVTDAQGAPLPGVSVEATSPKMVGKASAVTDAAGDYRLFSLPSGLFDVTFTLQGFKTLKREGIVVQLSQNIIINAKLDQAALEEQVTVVGMSPLIDVRSTVKSQTMTKEVFMSLPRSRNFDGLLSTVPGVQYESNTGGLSVDGATGTENMWYMDGTDISSVHIGTRAQSAVMEMVEEVKVTASGYNAEFGGSMGGVVNVITRSGGNAFHGDLMGYYNNNTKLMEGKAREYLRWNPYNDDLMEYVNDDDLYYQGGVGRNRYNRYEAVLNLGGFILKDRLWFFGSFNPQYALTKANRYFLPDPVAPAKRTYYPYATRTWVWNGQFKLTAAPIKGLRVSASFVNNYSYYRGAIPNYNGTSSSTYEYWKEGFDYPNMSAAFMADYSLGNNLLISTRVGYSTQNTKNQQIANNFTTYYFNYMNTMFATDPFFVANPTLQHSAGWANYGGTWTATAKNLFEKYSGNLDLTYYLNLGGEHAWKAGVQFIRDQEDVNRDAGVYPHVNLYWNATCTALIPYGVPATRGTYGYYRVISSWTSPYGAVWKVKRNNWAVYLQDSWTIGGKLTLNAGLRTESEYIPAMTTDQTYAGYSTTPIKFGFDQKLAPRLGAVYDVFGDSSLKVFASFGIYYDVMKLYMAEGTYGGLKWKSDYYTLNNPRFTDIAANGLVSNTTGTGLTGNAGASQSAGGTYLGSIDFRVPSFDSTDPGLKPTAQREISIGAEKKLTENISLSLRLVNKHLIRTIEDVGVVVPGGEKYYISNPGFGYSLPIAQGGKFDDAFWPTPKAKREYYGMNVSLETRFSNNWQGGINYTYSQVKGNYGGLSSTDEGGRNSPNVERSYDFWYMTYDLKGNMINGPLPQDRTHYIKAYGSYAFPFGLTVGVVGYGRSGFPLSTRLDANNAYIYVNNYGDLGRLPFTVWGDIYLEYNLKVGSKTIGLNFQVNNFTNTKTWQSKVVAPSRYVFGISDAQILSKTYDWQADLPNYRPNAMFNKYSGHYGTWSTRLGAKFSF
jgi:hypothetical protein